MAKEPTPAETKRFFKKFGARIAEFRQECGLTQAQLGEVIGFSQQQVASFEKGIRKVPVSVLPELAKTFGVSLDELVGYDSSPKQGRRPKLQRQLERLSQLPKKRQQMVSEVIEALLSKAS